MSIENQSGAVAAFGHPTDARLEAVRAAMAEDRLDALIVRSTDRYLSEYVPRRDSLRIWLSGFAGSVGDLVVTSEQALVFVDGRYYLQAERETAGSRFEVVRVALGDAIASVVASWLDRHLTACQRLGYEPEKVSIAERERLLQIADVTGCELVACADNLVARARGPVATVSAATALEAIPESLTGEPSAAKLGRLRAELETAGVDAMIVTRLDEIAWLTDVRGWERDYNSTFAGIAYVDADTALLCVDGDRVGADVERTRGRWWTFADETGWAKAVGEAVRAGRRRRVLLDRATTSVAVFEATQASIGAGAEPILGMSPIATMKSRKNCRELEVMADAFARADRVVATAIAWLTKMIDKGRRVSERQFAERVEELFREAGARSLSFRVIAAAGENGAIIHYKDASPERAIRRGELMLLDTGAYFESGYPTDLTRTFVVGNRKVQVTREQKRIFTLVLKAAIRGMKARFPIGTTGMQLDALVRAPIWDAGLDYAHGTGHGVGVLVHEAPPTVSTRSQTPLEPGQVFSIEPGIYIPGWGGVRIENLVTIEADSTPGFLRVRPLTFCPLDRRLIDGKRLTTDEKAWLRRWRRRQV